MLTEKDSARAFIRKLPTWQTVALLVVVAAMAGALVAVFSGPRTEPQPLDADLCPKTTEEISGSAMLLYDFVKPLSGDQASLPSNLLREIGRSMERNAELRVFSLAQAPGSPRTLLKRLCKPYANADLRVGWAWDQDNHETPPDCGNLPAQLPSDIREPATAFCNQLQSLENKIKEMVRTEWPKERNIQNAYLVEALEDMVLDLGNRPEPHAIYVVSDMMQHATWYSHLNPKWANWSHEAFAKLMAEQIWGNLNPQGTAGKQVEIFYVPRRGLTDQTQVRQIHQRFWRSYFAGSELAFHNQLTAPAYSFNPLVNVLTEAEQASQERRPLEPVLPQVREESAQPLEEERPQLERERSRQRLLDTGPTVAEASDARSEEGEEQEERKERVERVEREAHPPEPEQTRSQPPLEPTAADAADASEAQLPPEGAPRPEPERRGPPPPPPPREPNAEDGTGVGAHEAPPAPEAAESGRVAETAPATEQPGVRETSTQGQPTRAQEPAVGQPQPPATCALRPWQETGNVGPEYPRGGRMNMGSATITVRFEVDAQGATVDDEVVVVADESHAESERYLELFATAAIAAVQDWQLAFVETADEGCVKRQTDTVELKFEYSGRFYPTRNVR
ncbi:MAG: hypothetical protein OXU70_00025 [Gammaproteobacteria bacterium]|nr:hypothetical protein [Gammaproteobacteria bacterium]